MYHYEKRGTYKPSRYFRTHWEKALQAAKLVGRRIHDFRRSGIRRFGERGLSDAVGMQLSVHRSRAIYDRYKAIGAEDLFEAAEKLAGEPERHKNDTKMAVKKP